MSIFDTPASPPEGGAPPDAGVAAPVTPTPPTSEPGNALGVPPAEPVTAVEPPAAPQYLDVDEYKDHLVRIKVGNEERELPFSQVRDGLMMQQDYTRKTQELAEDRRRLRQADALVAALEANPADTLRQLSEAYDLDPVQGFNRVERAPEEQAMIERQRSLAVQEQQLQQQRIDAELAQVRSIDPNVDVPALARMAYERQVTLPVAHQLMQFEQMQANQQAQAAAQQRQQAAQAAQVVHSGAATQRGAVSAAAKPINTIAEAWAAAKANPTR